MTVLQNSMVQLLVLILALLHLVTYASLTFGFFQYRERKRIERLMQVICRIEDEETEYRKAVIQFLFISSWHYNRNPECLEEGGMPRGIPLDK
jgi:cell division protein FtsL